MKPDIEKLRKKYMDNPPEGMSSRDIRRMSEEELQFKRAPKAVFPIKQKRCQKHRMAPDTSFDRLHFSVQQVFAEIRIVWQLVDIWLPAPLDFG